MTKKWTNIVKSIGIFQIIWGCLDFGLTIFSFKLLLNIGQEHFDMIWKDFSFIKIIKNYHF